MVSSAHKSSKVSPDNQHDDVGEGGAGTFVLSLWRCGTRASSSQMSVAMGRLWVRVVQYWSQLGLSQLLTFMSTKNT